MRAYVLKLISVCWERTMCTFFGHVWGTDDRPCFYCEKEKPCATPLQP